MIFRFLRLYTVLFLSMLFTFGGEVSLVHADDVATLERQVHELVNAHRATMGLEPLAYNEDIAMIARQHSRDMAKGVVGHGHEGAEEREHALVSILPYSKFGENVGGNNSNAASTVQAAMTGWLNSPGHRANIEGNFDTTGVGIARGSSTFFFTQIFLTTRSSRSPLETRRPHNRTLEYSSSSEDGYKKHPSRSRRAYVPDRKHDESDPRQRPGRKRVRGGYVQDLDTER